MAPQGPSQLLTALLVRLPDATNRVLIDQATIDFAFLNSKAARKRLVRVGPRIIESVDAMLTESLSSCPRCLRIERTFYLTIQDLSRLSVNTCRILGQKLFHS